MLALRQGAARLAPRRVQCFRTTKRYASGGGSGTGHNVDEPIGPGFWMLLSTLPLGCVVYYMAQPGENGEMPALTKWIQSYWEMNEVWKERNALHAKAVQQAGFDRLVFLTAPRQTHYDLRYPETFHSHSRRNITPGDLINLDAVTEKYRQQHLAEEERKALRMAARARADGEKKEA